VTGWMSMESRTRHAPPGPAAVRGRAWFAVCLVLLAAGCSGGTSAGNAPSSASGSVSVPATSASSASPSPESSAEREAAERSAVEQAWAQYWIVHNSLLDKPASEWPTAVDAIAVDPTRTQVLDEAATFEKSGMRFYGQVVNHPYWRTLIDGKSVAVMGDCMDSSHTGTLVVKTGVKRTVGVAKNNTRATLVKGSDGTWLVQKIEYLLDTPC